MGEVRVEQRGRILVARLDNPPHALMDSGTVDGLDRLVARAESDDEVGAVVLTGTHAERFVAHYDVGELLAGARQSPPIAPRAAAAGLRVVGAMRRIPAANRALERSPAAGAAEVERFHEIFLRMNRCGAVFIAALNGSAMGGGCELALACDLRLMASGEHGIGQPEILMGFPPGGGGTQRLARLLGSARALRLVLDGGPLTPAEAAELGLIDEVVLPERLMDRALELGERFGKRIKAAVSASKRAVYEGGSLPLLAGLRTERAEFLATVATPAAVESMSAYVELSERSGELPGYDREQLERALEQGRFTAE